MTAEVKVGRKLSRCECPNQTSAVGNCEDGGVERRQGLRTSHPI
jgi:hypothetical protein